jgi:diguanylate cyclase (GGDEF)-like protein
MNKERIAIYLNEHPEFFNDFPELLKKIKALDESEMPFQPTGTLSLTDRILKRVKDDQDNLKNKLEWLVEISQANEKIQDHIFNIERLILISTNLNQLVDQLREEIRNRFALPHVCVCLVDGADHFIENKLKDRYGERGSGALKFTDQKTAGAWFPDGLKPVIRREVKGDSAVLDSPEDKEHVRSEILVPILVRGALAGALALGSREVNHFHEGQRTEYLEQMAEKLAIAVDNILLMDRLRKQSIIDKQTGLYNAGYLEPALYREFDFARRKKSHLSCLKLRVDYLTDLIDTYGETAGEQTIKSIGKVLSSNCRDCDILVRTDIGEILILLPEIDHNSALLVGQRVRKAMLALRFDAWKGFEVPAISIGAATYPGKSIATYQDLLHQATRSLNREMELARKRAV